MLNILLEWFTDSDTDKQRKHKMQFLKDDFIH